jgi:hypothetical protein
MTPSALLPDNRTLDDEDFHLWTQQTAELLRSGQFDLINIEHVAEEVESMGARDRREALSRLRVLLLHLFKWQIHAEHRSQSWSATIMGQRHDIDTLLEQSPSIRRVLPQHREKTYKRAVEDAVNEMGLLANPFPERCPFSLDEILDSKFLPEH